MSESGMLNVNPSLYPTPNVCVPCSKCRCVVYQCVCGSSRHIPRVVLVSST